MADRTTYHAGQGGTGKNGPAQSGVGGIRGGGTAGQTDNTVCENIWSRQLANGDVALAMVNQGANATMVCDSACFTAAGLGKASKVKVRDMIAHADLPELSPPFALKALVAGEGSAAAFRLTPAK